MSNDARGFLNDRLGGLQDPLPTDLQWAAMADRFPPPPPRRKRRFLVWWYVGLLVGLTLALTWLFWPAERFAKMGAAFPLPSLGTELAARIPDTNSSETPARTPTAATAAAASSIDPPIPIAVNPPAEAAVVAAGQLTSERQTGRSRSTQPTRIASTRRLVSVTRQLPTSRSIFPLTVPVDYPRPDILLVPEVVVNTPLPERSVYLSQPLPLGPVDTLPLVNPYRPPGPVLVGATSLRRIRRGSGGNWLTVGGGVLRGENLADDLPGLPTTYWSANYQRRFTPGGWRVRAGLRYERLTWSSQTTFDRPADLFRPGTVDTIFRNLTTGEERIVTVDTVAGILRTQFRGFGKLTLVSVPLGVGKSWALGNHRPGFWATVGPTFVVGRNGRFGDPINGLRSLADDDLFPRSSWWSAGLAVDYRYHLSPRWWVGAEAAVRTSLGSPYAGGEDAAGRVRRVSGGLRLGWRLW